MKIFKNIIKGILFAPLNAVILPLALIHIIVDVIIKRYKKVKNDLKSFIPVTLHKYKMWKRYKKRK